MTPFDLLYEELKTAVPVVSVTTASAVEGAARATNDPRARLAAAARARLSRLRLPPKPVVLVLCVCALRVGLVRTALSALSVKLSLELAQEVSSSVNRRLTPPPTVLRRNGMQQKEDQRSSVAPAARVEGLELDT